MKIKFKYAILKQDIKIFNFIFNNSFVSSVTHVWYADRSSYEQGIFLKVLGSTMKKNVWEMA